MKTELTDDVEKLLIRHYDLVDSLCQNAKKQIVRLLDLEKDPTLPLYVSICAELLEEVQNYVKQRKETLIPYLNELFEKNATNHDCATCNGTGTCSLKHKMQLAELTKSHKYTKAILNRLQMVALPLYSDTLYPDVYRLLRSNMALLESSLSELFYIEGTDLIPKVIEAQKNINVRT